MKKWQNMNIQLPDIKDMIGNFSWGKLRMGLVIGLLIEFVLIVFKLAGGDVSAQSVMMRLQSGSDRPAPDSTDYLTRPIRYHRYAIIGSRAIFKRLTPKAGKYRSARVGSKDKGPELQQLFARLRLTGIMGGPQAEAMIEDKSTGRTRTVRVNDNILGFTVEDIAKNRVTLSHEGQNYELQL